MKPETKQILLFLLLTFFISWVFMFGELLLPDADSPIALLLTILSVFGPGIAVLIVSRKNMSFKEFLIRTFTFEQRLSYYLIFLVWAVWRYLLCMLVGARVEGSSLILPLIMLPISIFTGGNEEIGWRYLQTLMEKKMHSVYAALIFSVILTSWHFPLFFVPGDWRKTLFDFFVIQLGLCLTNAITFAVIYKLTNSVSLCILAHAWGNSITLTFLPPGDIKTIVGFVIECIIGVIILVLCGKGIIKSAEKRTRSQLEST